MFVLFVLIQMQSLIQVYNLIAYAFLLILFPMQILSFVEVYLIKIP